MSPDTKESQESKALQAATQPNGRKRNAAAEAVHPIVFISKSPEEIIRIFCRGNACRRSE
jgi:hypothetical protein